MLIPTTRTEHNMNTIISTGKSILNALAFANVNRIDELHMGLNQMDTAASTAGETARRDRKLSASTHTAFSPSIGHIQGAL